jgi:hypothetical protein
MLFLLLTGEKCALVEKWQRVSHTATEKSAMFVNGVEPGDVIQGSLGNCWFLGPLSVIATNSDLLMNLFITTSLNEYGVYAQPPSLSSDQFLFSFSVQLCHAVLQEQQVGDGHH